MRRAFVAAAFSLLLAGNSQAAKKIVEGAPVCLDAAGKTVACPAAAPEKRKPEPAPPVDAVEGVARLAVQAGAQPKPAPAPAPPPRPFLSTPMFGAALIAGLLAAVLVLTKLKLGFAAGDFEFEPDPRGPGEAARGFLRTRERPEQVRAVLELYEDQNDVPRRTIPAEAGMPEKLPEGGWRTPISVTLPADLYPAFKGGWALSVEAMVDGRRLLAGDNPNLRPPA